MAYNKKTWLARLGQGLNKFSIDGATPVPIINQPDSVTQQGDALSAGNLNDLEQRIADAFDDVEESKADKSTTEALQSQINQHESRLENLEQKAGDYTTVQYRGTNAVPTGKAKNGLVEKIVGKTRAWNQLSNLGQSVTNSTTDTRTSPNLYFRLNTSPYTVLYSISPSQPYAFSTIQTASFSGNVQFIHSGSTSNIYFPNSNNMFTAISGHKYLLMGNITGVDPTTVGGIVIENLNIFDLTLIFGSGNEPSTVADALAQLPALGEYNAYDAGSLVDTEVSGVKSVGVNIWDEEWEYGGINSSTGANSSSSVKGRSVDFIPIKPNTAYYILSAQRLYYRFYDREKNYLGDLDGNNNPSGYNTLMTTPSACFFFRFLCDTAIADNSIQICLNSYADKTTYHPYKTDTISLSETVTLRGVGTCVETLDVETGVLDDGKFELVDMDDLEWTQVSVYYRASITGAKLPATPNDIANILSSNYKTVARNYTDHEGDIALETGGTVIVRTPTVPTGVLLYEKATYTPSLPIDPIIDNFIEVEGGGTVETIQTQTPVIDNCLDVGYLAV